MLTKKYYEMIAASILHARCACGTAAGEMALDILAWHLEEKCAMENPKFDRARFLQACGVQA